MNGYDEYLLSVFKDVSKVLKVKEPYIIIDEIAKKTQETGVLIDYDRQLLAGILGAKLHKVYCDGRKLDKPNEQGLPNNPRLKTLDSELDKEFVLNFKEQTIKTIQEGNQPDFSTLFFKDGNVVMDIANTDFANLSPYWQKENYLAGDTAVCLILSNWQGLKHRDKIVRNFVEIAVASAIHECWKSRGNVSKTKDWDNSILARPYKELSLEEANKDSVQMHMAKALLEEIAPNLNYNKNNLLNTQKPKQRQTTLFEF